MTPEVRSRIEDEVRRFGAELNLSDAQKAQLRTAFEMRKPSWMKAFQPGKCVIRFASR